MAASETQPPVGIDHLTVVPTNFESEAGTDETGAPGTGEQADGAER